MKLWHWISNKLSDHAPRNGQGQQPEVTGQAPTRDPRYKLAMRLERRLMFDGAGVLTTLAELHHDNHSDSTDQTAKHDVDGGDHPFPSLPSEASSSAPREMIVVDPTVANYQTLLKGLPKDARVVVLDPNKDGVEQIRDALSLRSGIESLHIVSHGGPGYLSLGGSALDTQNVDAHTEALQEWGASLAENADILIYGCDVGAGTAGEIFVSRLAELTGADIAASTDATGAADLGGNWILERSNGEINSSIFLSGAARVEYQDILPSANPIITNIHGDSVAFAEGNAPVQLDLGGNATVSDADNVNFNGGTLTVAITVNRDAAEDVLSIQNQGVGAGQIGVAGANITYQGTLIGTYAGGSGTNDLVISLNANADTASVSALLHAITYTNTDTANPTSGARSIAFSMTDGSGGASAMSTAGVTVSNVNDPPTISAGGVLNHLENNAATVIDNTIVLSDVDHSTLQSATISISSNYQNGSDLLSFTNTGTITGSWNAATGTLTLTGNDTVANYQAALRSIKFQNTNDAPTTLARTISYQVHDGTTPSTVATATVNITAIDDAPTVTAGSVLNYTENAPATIIDNTITVADVDNATLQSATVQITSNYQNGSDLLLFTNTANITGVWNAASGTLTLTGTDTKANYQAALRSISFQNTSDAPTTTARTVSFQVNDGSVSSTAATATINVTAANDAPVLAGPGTWYLPPVVRTDTVNPAGTVISSLFAAGDITDLDPTPLQGIAIFNRTNAGVGSWQYRIDGGAWVNIPGGINSNNTLLLKGTDELRFKPNNSNSGQPTLSFHAWDQTNGVAGSTPNSTVRGGTTEFSPGSGTIRGTVNAAPVLDNSGAVTMTTITEDDLANVGQSVSAIVGSLITDIDNAPVEGIAIQSLTAASGNWYYSTNGGTSWSPFGVVSTAQSLLLRPTDMIRFVPDGMNPPGNAAPGTASFNFVAWDQSGQSTTWTSGTKVSTASRGLATPFSTNVETASISVTNLNDAPVLVAAAPTIPDIMHTDTNNAGVTISTLVGATISDVDAVTAPLEGIAIHTISNSAGGGYWEFSTDNGTTWTATGAVSNLQALLLRPQDKIRYQPNNVLDTSTSASFSYHAWDQTQNLGAQGTKADVTVRGGTTAYSVASDVATININIAPTLDATATPTFPTITEDATTNTGVAVSTLMGGATDVDVGAARGIAVYGLTSGNGTWQYNNGGGWTNVGVVGSASALLLRETDLIRFVPNAIKATSGTISFYAWDQTSGTSGTKVNVTTRGGSNAFSINSNTATIIATEVNDTPAIASGGTVTFTEGGAGTAVSSALTLSDIDDLTIAGATVRITGNYVSSEDVLAFTNQSGITGSWDSATGTMTLTGSATKAQYQTALRSVSYQNTNTARPSVANRTVTFTITDGNSDGSGGGALNASATRTIAITAINDAPILSTTGAALSVTEGDAPTAMDPGLTLSDIDDANLSGARVQITGNYLATEDLLSFTNQAGITGSWNAGLGRLTLTGAATKADYQTALRSVTYQNTNTSNPSILARTVTFRITDSNSAGEGAGTLNATATRNIVLTAVNDAPGVSTTVAPLAHTENAAAVAVDAGFSLADVDDTNIAGAVVQITGNYLASEDLLSFTNQAGITGSWNAATGTLTLTGAASKASYQTALRSVTYLNTNGNDPSIGTRTVTFSVTDSNSNGQGAGAITTSATRDIVVSAVNDAPGVATTAAPLAHTESALETVVDAGLSLADVDDANIAGATVQITGNYLASEDVLSFTNQAGITGSWNAVTGTLTLTGTATKASYQTALRSISYLNTNDDNPSVANRTVTFSVTDSNSNGQGAGAITTSASRTIVITAINDAPGVTATAAPLAYTEDNAAIAVDPGLSLADVDDTNVAGATVQITGNYLSSEDLLSFTNQAGITGSWNAATGTLTLTGTATKANYETALRSITYVNSNAGNPSIGTRTVTFSVTDGNSNGQGAGAITTSATRDIILTAVNDAPGITATAAPLAYSESAAATAVDAGLSLADVDDATIVGATVQITGNYLASEDVLSFTNQAGITGSWNAVTGTLTLTGTASKASYQTALRAITYLNTNNDTPSVANRTVTFSVTDGNSNGEGAGAITTSATRDIVITAINDAPGVATTAAPLAYTESDTAIAVDPSVSLADVDDANVAGAVVQITGNYLASEDVLSFTNQAGITGSWNAATGTLTLTGAASKASYQTALRSVTYLNTNNDNPSVANRTVTFSVTDGNSNGEGAGAITTSATRDIVLTAINDAPGVTTTAAPLAYTENDTATAVDAGLSLADVDDTNISGAVVQITGNYLASEDLLSFTNQAGITGSWNAATGTLTLTGAASKASYQTALRSVTYLNTNGNDPSIGTRTVTFSVTDSNSNGQGAGAITTSATREIVVTTINDAPGVSTTAAPLAYTESDTATAVDAGVSLADVDDANVAGAVAQITGNYLASEDVLSFTNQAGITGSWNAATGTLTLTGTATKADYETALR
ncbi:MAG: DUF4347 domain-containing protein, partial [Magnetococcales bacterium]|nr:DUF4347 domain-containing protein [Magnetococcales bacterium]